MTTNTVDAATDAEMRSLIAYLNAERGAVLAIIDGLDEDKLRTPIVPTGWTPIGLIWHLGGAEMYWFQIVVAGRLPEDDSGDDGPGAPFVTDEPIADVIANYRAQCRQSDEILASVSLSDRPHGPVDPNMADLSTDVRTIALHMIEETARHAGHLDIARELLDGATGLGPR